MPKKDAGTGQISAQAQQDLVSDGIENFELPRSVVQRIARAAVPDNTKLAKETVTALLKGSTVFINFLAATAHDVAISKQHKSISASDVIKAMELIGFGDMSDFLQNELNAYRELIKEKGNKKGTSSAGASGHKKSASTSSAAAAGSKGKGKEKEKEKEKAAAPTKANPPKPAAASSPPAAEEPMEVDGQEPVAPVKKPDVEAEAEDTKEDDQDEEGDDQDEEDEDEEDEEEDEGEEPEDMMQVEEEELKKDAKGLDVHDNTRDDDS